MKKNLFTGFTGISLLLVICIAANGQLASTNVHVPGDISNSGSLVTKDASPSDRNTVNSRAAKNFTRSYKNVSDEKWQTVTDGLMAVFSRNDIIYRVYYDTKGNFLHSVRSYHENLLPEDVRQLVKSSYYNYDIKWAEEIETPATNPTYVIHLEGKTKWINLRVSDGEMEEWQKFNKS